MSEDTNNRVGEPSIQGDVHPRPQGVRRVNYVAVWGVGTIMVVATIVILSLIAPNSGKAAAKNPTTPTQPASRPNLDDLISRALTARATQAGGAGQGESPYLLLDPRAAERLTPVPASTPSPLPADTAAYRDALAGFPAPAAGQSGNGSAGGSGSVDRRQRARSSGLLAASFRQHAPGPPNALSDGRDGDPFGATSEGSAPLTAGLGRVQQQLAALQATRQGAITLGAAALAPAAAGAEGVGGSFTQAPVPSPRVLQPVAPASPFVLHQGSLLPATLQSGVTSDLAGQTVAIVRRPVFDTPTGQYLLIPQGSRLIGEYDARLAVGQDRLLTAWTRLIFPDGRSIELAGLPATDIAGNMGLADRYNAHLLKVFGGALLMSAFSAGAQLSQPREQGVPFGLTNSQVATAAIGQELTRTGAALLLRNLDIRPTVMLRPGLLFDVQVTRDLVFASPYIPLTELHGGGTP